MLTPASNPRVVIAHDNLYWYGGAERIAATIAEALPAAPFWAILGYRDVADRMGIADRFHSYLPEWRPLIPRYREASLAAVPLMRIRPLPEADVLLTSSFAFAHHFRTRNDAPQVCYCYSPLRFAWSMTDDYVGEIQGGIRRRGAARLAAALQAVDRRAAARVTTYVAESRYVAEQIGRFYGREARVIYPPVDTHLFAPSASGGHGDFFLFSGRLVEAYKRPSLVVEAFRSMPGRRLVIAGDGPELDALRRAAGANVEFTGHLEDTDLVELMRTCTAAIFPSRDDFGLIPVEVNACGRPVLAYGAGGALETIAPGVTGEFFHEQTPAAIVEAVEAFDPDRYDPVAIRSHAEFWRRERFIDEIRSVVSETAERAHAA